LTNLPFDSQRLDLEKGGNCINLLCVHLHIVVILIVFVGHFTVQLPICVQSSGRGWCIFHVGSLCG